jgi:alkylation response protein AidB-like acyl-CoA dehydrogenase
LRKYEKVKQYMLQNKADASAQGMKGLEAPAIKNKVALRASLTGSVFMDNVKVGHDALLPKSKGLSSPFSCLNSARYVHFPYQDFLSIVVLTIRN